MIYNLIDLVQAAATIYTILIIARVIVSWVPGVPDNPLVGFVYRVTEPVMAPVRNLLPTMGGMDFTPMLVLVAVQILENLVVRLLLNLAQ